MSVKGEMQQSNIAPIMLTASTLRAAILANASQAITTRLMDAYLTKKDAPGFCTYV